MREKGCSKAGLSRVLRVCVVGVVVIALVGAGWRGVGAERARPDSWDNYREQAAQAFQKDDLRQAENLLLEALHDAERLKKDGREVFVSLVELGWCEMTAEKYADAVGNLRRALALSETNHGAKALETRVCLAWLGELQLRQGDFEAAKRFLGRGAEILEGASRFCSEKVLCAQGLGQIAIAEVDYSKAEQYFKTALSLLNVNDQGLKSRVEDSALFRSPFRPTYPNAADVLNGLGSLYQTQKRWSEAEAAYRQALEMVEKDVAPKSGAVPAALNALASVYLDQTNFAAARPLLERSLKAQEEAVNPIHPVLIPTLLKLAQVEDRLGDRASAERDYRRILSIREKSLGPDHIRVQDSLRDLSQFYLRQKDFAAAEPLCRRMLAREESFRGETSITLAPILSDQELIYRAEGKLKELEAVYQKQMRVFESAFGPQNNSVAKVLDQYAALLRGQQREAEAAKLQERARAIREPAGK
jgi:tetratricopeptide (TPR) repeat protein